MKNKLQPTYKIENNNDWANLKDNETLVDISDDAYFGFRAMQKNAKAIIYNPNNIDNLIRISKESKKFGQTKHILILDSDYLGFEAGTDANKFLSLSCELIDSILSINSNLSIDFEINTYLDNVHDIVDILNKIYKENINK